MSIDKQSYEEKLHLYEKLVAEFPDIKRKGKTMPYTSLNGHMFTFLDKEGKLAIRLPKDEQNKFMETINPEPCLQYGKTMRGYVVIPDEMLSNLTELIKYFRISLDYIASLKPKPTTKKKAR